MRQRVFSLPRQQSLLQPAVFNPFAQDLKLTTGLKLKCLLLGVLLVPLRCLLLLLLLLLAWPIAAVATLLLPLKGNVEPMSGWRRCLSWVVLAGFGRLAFCIMGFRVSVRGRRAGSAEAPILAVAPHSSYFDSIVCIVAGAPSTVSRTENLSAPIFGRFLRCLQPVLVSRLDPDSRKNTILEIERRATSGGRWPQVLIFPEGTCTNRACLITFKQGAFIPRVPVQPVLLRYPNKLDTVTWTWQGPKGKMLFLLTLCQLYTNVEIEFLPPEIPGEKEKANPTLFANAVRSVMATALHVPVTDHTYEDCRLMISAGELTLPMEAGLVEFTKISRKLNLKWDNVKKELEGFSAIAQSCQGGRITLEEFAHFLKLPVSRPLEELFSLFDRNGDGTIDFREYVIGVTILCRPANTDETIQMAFKLFDTDKDGNITHSEFSALIRSALGVPELDVSRLFSEIDVDSSGHITYEEFRTFALTHPEYAKLFTTYLELQRYHALQGMEPETSRPANSVCPEDTQEDSSSDKKED
ncbi:lysophosphatidylcholine acyltransferase 2 [Paramormyrops kingsleyae]|uniref:Lysophosphatidylcholine acyltransferase 2 n=1 Tax=Paramormyrops kingsleyae TaxID=1676925 RepID=A0A3B3QGS7_9TELE|nr:lysophosphatidylcholine acyltransferase 2 [Paramormyrops kingsleyae]